MKNINLYFIRHGQTEWNLENKLQGAENSHLTEEGILGAKLTGKYLRSVPFLKAYSSPLQRAIETRDYIVNELDAAVPVDIHPGFSEMDFGLWEGQFMPKLADDPDFNLYMNHADKFDHNVNQGEGFVDVMTRFQQGLDDAIATISEDQGNILIVSHGTALRLMLCVLNGGDWRQHRNEAYFPKISNTSISVVNYQQEHENQPGKYTLTHFNQLDHLD